jgi:hypothetical protein
MEKIWTKEEGRGKNQSCYTANVPPKNPSWTVHTLNQGPRGCMPATNPPDYGTALRIATVFRIGILC